MLEPAIPGGTQERPALRLHPPRNHERHRLSPQAPRSALSIPERLLAIADVFEALTASDRPYKKAKPISAALDILHDMVLDNHLDRACFELFVREKVYLRYARAFLSAKTRSMRSCRKNICVGTASGKCATPAGCRRRESGYQKKL
ncbi:MAG: hypothetical protein R3E54_05815 [Halioglobus sp.]